MSDTLEIVLNSSSSIFPTIPRFVAFLLVLGGALEARAYEPRAFYLDYQFNVPTDILTSHAEAIVHPATNVDLAAAQAAGTKVYAYISVGELGKDAPHRQEALDLGLPLRGQNPIWESDLLDLVDGRWADFLVDRVAKEAADLGFAGFFLDTLDSVEYEATSVEAEAQRAALIQLIKQLKTTHPEQSIIVNRGFKTLSALQGVADGLLVESVFSAYDFEGNFYRPEDPEITSILLDEMQAAIDLGFEVYVLDYADPTDPAAALAAANRILAAGYHAFVSTPELDGDTLGPWLPVEPGFLTQPFNVVLRPGQSYTLNVSTTGEPEPAISWLHNGEVIEGANAESLQLSQVDQSDSGSYHVRLTNRVGSVVSDFAEVSVSETAETGRLLNLSARTWAGIDAGQLTPGIVSSGPVDVLARAVGPTLSDFDVPDILSDPTLAVVRAGEPRLFNDDWQDGEGAETLSEDAAAVGAFPLHDGSAGSALRFRLNGAATLPVDGKGETGNTLVEVYLIDSSNREGKLLNLSTRAEIRPETGAIIVGFVLGGETVSKVLVRAIGPTLSDYGVSGVLADPRIVLKRSEVVLATNDDWHDSQVSFNEIVSTTTQVGAFALGTDSADAALLIDLTPGVYTATVSGHGSESSGVVLAEIYLVP